MRKRLSSVSNWSYIVIRFFRGSKFELFPFSKNEKNEALRYFEASRLARDNDGNPCVSAKMFKQEDSWDRSAEKGKKSEFIKWAETLVDGSNSAITLDKDFTGKDD